LSLTPSPEPFDYAPATATLTTMAVRKLLVGVAVTTAVVVGGAIAVGDYVYREGTSLSCAINDDQLRNQPAEFYPSGVDNGPFPGDGWNRWVEHDLSDYWLTTTPVVDVTIPVEDGVELRGWWLEANDAKATVIVTHGYGASRRDFNTLLPTSMLIREEFNVLLVDQRNSGESTCTTGRHTAGQVESDDFARVAAWAIDNGYATPGRLGMFGVSGGGIATSILPAKTTDVSAFAIESAIFDFADTAIREVEYQGFPGFLWRLADVASRLRGDNLQEVPIARAVEALNGRPMMILHGTIDQRLAFDEAVKLSRYGASVGQPVVLEPFVGSDHTEGMLTEPERYQRLLGDFFRDALTG
jgi:dipeptidyl aminopeptidase/acylaminoacyl peptidase